MATKTALLAQPAVQSQPSRRPRESFYRRHEALILGPDGRHQPAAGRQLALQRGRDGIACRGGDVDRVDLMVGMFAEDLPEGFGFSDTAFRVFILMASRRLKSQCS